MSLADVARDLLSDAWASIRNRPSRSLMAVAAFGVGIGGLICAIGISRTAAQQIVDELTPSDLDEVRAAWVAGPNDSDGLELPDDAEDRARALPGVVVAGRQFKPGADVRAQRISASGSQTNGHNVGVVVATPGVLDVAEAEIKGDAVPLWLLSDPDARVALIGKEAAVDLGIHTGGPGVNVWVGGRSFVVLGIIESAERDSSLSRSVIIGRPAALDVLSLHPSSELLMVRTEPQRARAVAEVLDLAINPQEPERIRIEAPPDLANVRRGVATELDRLALMSAIVVLGVSGIAISNTMAMGVLGRRGEIGLRRALGASSFSIASLFITEATFLGLIGGLVGIIVANTGLITISLIQNWTPVFVPWLGPASILLGLIVGMASGSYPSWSAARVNPAVALKSS